MTTTLSSPPTASQGAGAAGVPVGRYPARAKTGRKVLILVGLAVVVAVAAAWAAIGWTRSSNAFDAVTGFRVAPRTFTVILKEKGELKAANSTDVKCEVEGRSTIINLVAEGTAVKEGDLLVELASDQIDERIQAEELKETNLSTAYEAAQAELEIQKDKNASDIRKADLQVVLKKLALDKYEKGDWPQQLQDAKIAIEQAEITVRRREQDFNAAKKLLDKKFTTRTEFDKADFDFKKAKWELDKTRMALTVLEEYTNRADHRQVESDFQEAQKERDRVVRSAAVEETKKTRAVEGKEKELELTRDKLAKLRTQKDKCRINAPTPGFVVYYSRGWWGSDDQIKEGATVRERQILMELPDTSSMIVKLRIHEAKTDRIELGQSATVEVEGVPGRQFAGTVSKIAVVADTQNRWLNPDLKEYETEIKLDATDASLKPGATAHVEILVEAVENVLAIPVQTVYTRAEQRYVFRQKAGAVEPVEVKLGAIATEWAEVTDGLSAGDEICLAFGEEHVRSLPDPAPQTTGNGPGGKAVPNKKHGKGQTRPKPAQTAKHTNP